MRAKRFRTIVFFLATIASCNVSSAQDAASAKAFLNNIYRQYQNRGKGIAFYGPEARLYFHSSLLALGKANLKATGPDFAPTIDWDPICGCQDWAGIWDLKIEVHVESPQAAKADVSFAVFNPKDGPADDTSKLRITLVKEHGEWRIYDILDRSDPKSTSSVRKLLEDDLASLWSHPAPLSH